MKTPIKTLAALTLSTPYEHFIYTWHLRHYAGVTTWDWAEAVTTNSAWHITHLKMFKQEQELLIKRSYRASRLTLKISSLQPHIRIARGEGQRPYFDISIVNIGNILPCLWNFYFIKHEEMWASQSRSTSNHTPPPLAPSLCLAAYQHSGQSWKSTTFPRL